jgi:hypothetical protein
VGRPPESCEIVVVAELVQDAERPDASINDWPPAPQVRENSSGTSDRRRAHAVWRTPARPARARTDRSIRSYRAQPRSSHWPHVAAHGGVDVHSERAAVAGARSDPDHVHQVLVDGPPS